MSSKSPKDSLVLIEGIPVPPGGKPGVRQEFSTWSTSKPEESIQVSLFVRALQRFYDRRYTDTLSYFQVAGGFPFFKNNGPVHSHPRGKQEFMVILETFLGIIPTLHNCPARTRMSVTYTALTTCSSFQRGTGPTWRSMK